MYGLIRTKKKNKKQGNGNEKHKKLNVLAEFLDKIKIKLNKTTVDCALVS